MKTTDKFESTIQKVRGITLAAAIIFTSVFVKEHGIEGFLNLSNITNEAEDNIYDENSLILTEEEKKELAQKLEIELGLVPKLPEEDSYLLLNAVYENKDLSDEEKRIFYTLVELIEETPQLDKETTYNTLQTIRYSYRPRPANTNEKIQARYNEFKNEIEFFNLDSSYYISSHESIHGIFRSTKIWDTLPTFLCEGVTELLNREYLGTDPFSPYSSDFYDNTSIVYLPEITAVKLLCELVGPEAMLTAYSNDNVNVLYDALADAYKDKKEAKKLVNGLKGLIYRFKQNPNLEFEEQDEELFSLLEEYGKHTLVKQGNDYDNEFSKTSYNYYKNMLKCMYSNQNYGEKLERFVDENGIVEKGYFCESLKEEARNGVVLYQNRLVYMNGRIHEKNKVKVK